MGLYEFLIVALIPKYWKFVRGLEESDWARYDYYSRKIRRLGKTWFTDDINGNKYRDRDGIMIHENVLCSLGTYRPARTLLPNLRTVVFSLKESIALPCAQPLFGPSITSVSFTSDSDSETEIPSRLPLLFSSLLRLSPYIQEVKYDCFSLSQVSPPPPFFRFICSLQHLQILCLETRHVILPAEVWKSLAEHGTLKGLSGVKLTLWDLPALSTFVNMTTLDFLANWETSLSILDSMYCGLEELSLYIDGDPWQLSALQTFTDRLSRHSTHMSLTCIMFDTSIVPDGSSTSLSQSLRPLFSCKALQQVVLLSLPFHALDDSWLLDAALAWNSPSYLRLDEFPNESAGPGPEDGGTTSFSLEGLIPLVKHCPELQHLELAFNAKAVNPKALYGVFSRCMRCLFVYKGSTITCPEQVTRVLVMLFPHLASIDTDGGIADYEAWFKVRKWIKQSAYCQ